MEIRLVQGSCPRDCNRAVVVSGLAMKQPQGVNGHCMTSLKTKTKAPSKDERVGRPRVYSMPKRHCMWEGKEVTDLLPNCLSHWTRKDEVSYGLQFEWAVVTEHLERTKPLHAITQGQSVQEKLVKRLLLSRSPCPVVETLPDICRKFAELADSTRLSFLCLPGEGASAARLSLQESASNGSCQRDEHHTRNLNVGV